MNITTTTASKQQRGRGLTLVWGEHPSPWGRMRVARSAKGLCWLGINAPKARMTGDFPRAQWVHDPAVTGPVVRDLLRGKNPPVHLQGTAFQLRVWRELLKVKSGETLTYQDLARRIRKPSTTRAVASAVAQNPVSLIVPCHRIVNKDGRVQYAWGPAIKRALLKAEGVKL